VNILAVIPARGGSKGIPQKNIYPLNGKPLLLYTIDALKSSNTELFIVVSTDNEKISNIAREENVYTINRPSDISSDMSKTESALLHALDYLKAEEGRVFDYILTAQPTSPFRKSSTIDKFIEHFLKNKDRYNAQLTLHEDFTDFWIRNEKNDFKRLYPDAPRRRQERNPLYAENSCLYITDTKILKETNSILGNKCNGFIIDAEEAIDINETKDIQLAEALLKIIHLNDNII
jgi:CMP-N-acetylneuraminic acid synthetase